MRLLERYSRKVLARRVSGMERQIRLIPVDQVRKVAILWQEDDLRAFNFLQDKFKSKSSIIRHLCYSTGKVPADSNVLTAKDVDWLGFPRGGIVETFLRSEFDLLLNVSIQPCFPLEVITALSRASFKIGYDMSHSGLYDLSIDVSKLPDSLYLAEQQIIYLKKLTR